MTAGTRHSMRWIGIITLLALLVAAGPRALPDADAQGGEPITASFSPPDFSATLCGDACITQRIVVQLPARDVAPQRGLDLVLLMDVTGSMDDELESVKTSAGQVVQDLRELTSDMRFAFAIYADYPNVGGAPGDTPYELVSPFTTDLPGFLSQIEQVDLQNGNDEPESGLRALDEIARLDWRPDAIHVVVLFTDAPFQSPDPGPDSEPGTSDDIQTGDVYQALKDHKIVVFGVQSNSSSEAEDELRALGSQTGGKRFPLRSADDIPQVIVQLVGSQIKALQLRLTPAVVGSASSISGGIQITPESFDYPDNGQPITIEIRLCPYVLDWKDGSYTVNFDLLSGEENYGTVKATIDYHAFCSDVFLFDNAADTGLGCSDIDVPTFWESPDIIVRRQPDGVHEFQFPQVGQQNVVYVQVHNRGTHDAQAAQLTVYTSANPFDIVFPGQWREVASASIDVAANSTTWAGPFAWVADQPHVALRATIATSEDPITLQDDVACDNNIAQLNLIPMVLDIPSYGSSVLGGELPIHIQAPPDVTYRTLDFIASTGDLKDSDSVRLWLDAQTFADWERTGGEISGGEVTAPGQITARPGQGPLTLKELVGGPSVEIDAQLAIATANSQGGQLAVRLDAADRTWLGASIRYTVETKTIPARRAPSSTRQSDPPPWKRADNRIPIILTVGLVVLCIIGYTLRRRTIRDK